MIIVDVVAFGGAPGDLRLFGPDELRSDDVSTHAASLSVAAEYLKLSCGADVVVLAAQPARVQMGEGLSRAVERAVHEVEQLLIEVLGGVRGESSQQ